jgi:hypothetical protein
VRCSGPLLRTTVGALRLFGTGAHFALGVVSHSMGTACGSRCCQVSRSVSRIDGVQVNESYIMRQRSGSVGATRNPSMNCCRVVAPK